MQSIKQLIMLGVMLLLLASTAFSQTLVLQSKGDTIICFSFNKARYLEKRTIKANELAMLLILAEGRIKLLNDAYVKDSVGIVNLQGVIVNKNEAIELKSYEVKKLEGERKDFEKAIRRQKIYKWVAIAAGAVGTGYLGYLNFKK